MSTSESPDRGEASPNRAVAWAKKAANLILAQYLIIGFAVACVLGYFFPCMSSPMILGQWLPLPGDRSDAVYNLSPEKLKKNVTNWRLHIIVQGISFAIIPAIILGKLSLWYP
ncbi:hypothetical protein AUP68_13304 [Ilyonectria robusta]